MISKVRTGKAVIMVNALLLRRGRNYGKAKGKVKSKGKFNPRRGHEEPEGV